MALECVGGTDLQVLAFFEAINALPTGRGVIFFFDFLDALIGLLGLEFRVAVVGREVCGVASKYFFSCDVGKAVVLHLIFNGLL